MTPSAGITRLSPDILMLHGMTFRIAQISDTHLSAGKPFFVPNFTRIAEGAAADAPDLLVNTGDISLDGVTCEADLAEARRLHDGLDLPVRYVPGNHDIGDNQDIPGPHGYPIDAARRQRYRRHFGADWWSLDVPGWRLLALNAQLFGSDLEAAQEQEEFVAETVAGVGTRRLALFVHKPLFDRSPDEETLGGRFLNPAPRRRLLASLAACRPRVVACGHVHQYRVTEFKGTRHVWGPSTGFVLPDELQPRYGRLRPA